MNHYAMIFRTTRSLNNSELKTRATEIQTWVLKVRQKGIQLEPRNFQDVLGTFEIDAGTLRKKESPKDASLTTIVFFEAEDDATAEEIAKEHPGPRYGVTLELRRWTAPER